MSEGELLVTSWPKPKSRLILIPGFEIEFPTPRVNVWWRMWQWLLLGWKWKSLEG